VAEVDEEEVAGSEGSVGRRRGRGKGGQGGTKGENRLILGNINWVVYSDRVPWSI
jgi:hypothetical protein